MKRRNQPTVTFHPHAIQRARERLPGVKLERLRGWVINCLPGALMDGVKVRPNGSIRVRLGPGVWVACVPRVYGGWEVLTVVAEEGSPREGAEEDVEETEEAKL